MNKKRDGFAATGILYTILIIFLVLLTTLLVVISSRSRILGRLKDEAKGKKTKSLCDYYDGQIWEYDYTGDTQTFMTKCEGNYQLEVWGAQGGTSTSKQGVEYAGGKGGYATGRKHLQKGKTIYIVVGGLEGINGGGFGYNTHSGNANGGDATHMALSPGTLSSLENDKSSILLVAGGGGGGFGYPSMSTPDYSGTGGAGGGLTGSDGIPSGLCYWKASGGSQDSGGVASYCSGITSSTDGGIRTYNNGSFGKGGTNVGDSGNPSGGAGGSGYYGGASAHWASGAGGSSYVGGVTNGSTESGVRKGTGYAKITYLGS